ncbi:hypothetical protein B0H17DRAFT_1124957 [Mycena rosella]|uniref:Uncharacterized protein n=1 Tax=Mycena rosella TaxID=1033263 RepID=A0AAD7GYM1_MYCRO|nr:hypothetical protein B0H17DRAFT_1124957 [Mycena rosella]
MQTELPGYFVHIPACFPRPNGGAYVAPASEPPRARPLKQLELPEFFQRGLPPFLQYLKQDHANHVRKNELMCDRRFLGRETRQPVPRQATVALRLPHTLAFTPEEHQDNTLAPSVAVAAMASPLAADTVPVAGTGEMFWPGPGGDEDEGHENGWLTDLIDELDAEGL